MSGQRNRRRVDTLDAAMHFWKEGPLYASRRTRWIGFIVGKILYPLSTYKLYAMLSTMHFNTLTLAELAGERRVQRIVEVQRKFFTRTSRTVFKSPVQHSWRDQITPAVLEARQRYHEVPPDEVDLQAIIDVEAGFDGGESEDLL
ncbi:hypothetical protein Y032_0145g2503 [Ancylostoma ceylanicum]|uniref:Uncharacterized protein n=1 Tax=Ancylostoma ceylanicum TaxID=53326 RepID=A0A016T1S3_9BILA|nr:hypothetical protein Y032_0145g2503 [Ancylostoma ceylanicum]